LLHIHVWDKGRDVHFITTCYCETTQTDITYRQCVVSLRRSATYYTALTLFDTGAYTSFVNRKVARWLEQQEDIKDGGQPTRRRSSRFDTPTEIIGLWYCSIRVTKSDNVLQEIEANVIDSYIEVIIDLPDIRTMRLIPSYFDTTFLAPTYTPEIKEVSLPAKSHVAHLVKLIAVIAAANKPNGRITAISRGARPCASCATFIEMGYSNTLCSLSGHPLVP